MDSFNSDGHCETLQISKPCNLTAKLIPFGNEIKSIKEMKVHGFNTDRQCGTMNVSHHVPCNLAEPIQVKFNTVSCSEMWQISQTLPCNILAAPRPLENEIKYFKKIEQVDLNPSSSCEISQSSQPLPCYLEPGPMTLENETKSSKKIDQVKFNTSGSCEMSQISQPLPCYSVPGPKLLGNDMEYSKKIDNDQFNTSSSCEMSQISQPLPCYSVPGPKLLGNDMEYSKKIDNDQFKTSSSCEMSQISQPLPCYSVPGPKLLGNDMEYSKKIDNDQFNTSSSCEMSQISQPLPCYLVAKSRPLHNEIKSFQKNTSLSTTEECTLSNSKSKNQVLKSIDEDSNNFMNVSHKSQYRNPLVEVDINSTAVERSQSCPKLKNKNILYLSKSQKNPNVLRKKSDSNQRTLKIKPLKAYSRKENIDMPKSLDMSKSIDVTPKIRFTPARKRFSIPPNKINEISDSESKKCKLIKDQNEPAICVKTKDCNEENLSVSSQYLSNNKCVSDLNCSQPTSPVLLNRKMTFTIPTPGKKIKRHKELFMVDSSMNIDKCANRPIVISLDNNCKTENLLNESRESEPEEEPRSSPILGSAHVNVNGERPVVEEMDASGCLSPVLGTTYDQYSFQTGRQLSNHLQKRRTRRNILRPLHSLNNGLFTEDTTKIPTNLCFSEIEQVCPTTNGMDVVDEAKHDQKCLQKPMSPNVSLFDYKKHFLFTDRKYETERYCQQELQEEQLSPVLDSSQYRKSFDKKIVNVKNKSLPQQNENSSLNMSKKCCRMTSGSNRQKKSLKSSKTTKSINKSSRTNQFCILQDTNDTSSLSNLAIDKDKSLFCLKTSDTNDLFEQYQGKIDSDTHPVSPVLDSSQYKNRYPLKNLSSEKFSKNKAEWPSSKSSPLCDTSPVFTYKSQETETMADIIETVSPLFVSSPRIKQHDFVAKTKEESTNSQSMFSTNFEKGPLDLIPETTKCKSLDPLIGLDYMQFVLQDVFLGCTTSDDMIFDSFSPNTRLEQEDCMFEAPTQNTEYDLKNFPLAISQMCYEFMTPFNFSEIIDNVETSFFGKNFIQQPLEFFQNSEQDSNFSFPKSIESAISYQFSERNGNKENLHESSQDKLLLNQMSPDLLKVDQNRDLYLKSNINPSVYNISHCCEDLETDGKAKTSNTCEYVQSSPQEIYFNNRSINKSVKKKLSLLFSKSPTKKQSVSVNNFCENVQRLTSKDMILTDNEEENDSIILSGVERLSEHVLENAAIENYADNLMREDTETGQRDSELCAASREKTNTSQEYSSMHRLEDGIPENRIVWKSSDEFFETQYKTCIEEFDEESPKSKNDCSPISESAVTQRNLISTAEGSTLPALAKPCRSEVKDISHEFETCFQTVNTCDVESSEESGCEPDIEESSQESVRSADIQIECSTSSNTKSTQESDNNVCSGRLSFPPELKVSGNRPSVEHVLDSACKPRRKRMKRDSLVERMRRLVRVERAEVNMFRHEGAPRSVARACSLLVESVVSMCSRLVLTCRYADAHCTYSEPFSAGEEVVDPVVCVFVDANYAKHLKSGSTILVYPPWHSVWLDGRGVVMMYGVTKVQLISSGSGVNKPCVLQTSSLQRQFHCQDQEDECECQRELMGRLWSEVETSPELSWAADSVKAVLTRGRYPHNIRLRLTTVHRFRCRNSKNQILQSLLCVDSNGDFCQLNLRSAADEMKLDNLLEDSQSKTLVLHKLTICKRLNIDKCKGLRSMLSQLHQDSATQQMLYVVTPSSAQWSAQLAAASNTCLQSAELLSLSAHQESEGRLSASVQVMAVRGDQLYVKDKLAHSYFKINISSAAALPSFSSRSYLLITYLCKHGADLTIDKYSVVTVVERDFDNSPSAVIPRLSLDSVKDDLVLLDSVVIRVNSDVYLRWAGACGHNLLKLQTTELFYCVTCAQTVSTCEQKIALEVCVNISDVPAPIRVKVKNETAKVLLQGSEGHISSNKSYNLIGVIGSSLKCLTVVLEVLKNPFGDILEFLLEEL